MLIVAKKHTIDCDDEFWNEILKYKIDAGHKNLNDTVLDLLQKGIYATRNDNGKGNNAKKKQ